MLLVEILWVRAKVKKLKIQRAAFKGHTGWVGCTHQEVLQRVLWVLRL